MSFDDFLRDQRTIHAVVRKLTIIGESAVHVPGSICELNPDISWNDMRAMRNFVVHWDDHLPAHFHAKYGEYMVREMCGFTGDLATKIRRCQKPVLNGKFPFWNMFAPEIILDG
jgi:hypothetical protein